ncbi:MAG TPA: leucyl/phenylalanyl-tRNA--protein transferase [Thermoanaerobaculia bacterium]|nr:leucyl/phenylalanyl-tRNA--protein transferase [Thermoanaerobaculia bacterium]
MLPRRRRPAFPRPIPATADGIVAVGGRPEPEVLRASYSRGIFPWPHEGAPLLWFCPDPRFVLPPREAHLPRSLRKVLRRGGFEVRADTRFGEVIRRCSETGRPGQDGTWITPGMIAGYTALHEEGLAHSIEAWRDGELAGGLYGVSLGGVFFGESMFTDVPDASKAAFATLAAQLARWDFPLIDCQQATAHLARFGAREWSRRRFLRALDEALALPTRPGPWTLEITPAQAAEELTQGGSLS